MINWSVHKSNSVIQAFFFCRKLICCQGLWIFVGFQCISFCIIVYYLGFRLLVLLDLLNLFFCQSSFWFLFITLVQLFLEPWFSLCSVFWFNSFKFWSFALFFYSFSLLDSVIRVCASFQLFTVFGLVYLPSSLVIIPLDVLSCLGLVPWSLFTPVSCQLQHPPSIYSSQVSSVILPACCRLCPHGFPVLLLL